MFQFEKLSSKKFWESGVEEEKKNSDKHTQNAEESWNISKKIHDKTSFVMGP